MLNKFSKKIQNLCCEQICIGTISFLLNYTCQNPEVKRSLVVTRCFRNVSLMLWAQFRCIIFKTHSYPCHPQFSPFEKGQCCFSFSKSQLVSQPVSQRALPLHTVHICLLCSPFTSPLHPSCLLLFCPDVAWLVKPAHWLSSKRDNARLKGWEAG